MLYCLRRRNRMATPPSTSRRVTAASTPAGDSAGATCAGSGEQSPTRPGLSQDCPGGQKGSAQQVSSTQLPDMQSEGVVHAPPFGRSVAVLVAAGVLVTVPVDVTVGRIVAVRVMEAAGVAVTVPVVVLVAVDVEDGVPVVV